VSNQPGHWRRDVTGARKRLILAACVVVLLVTAFGCSRPRHVYPRIDPGRELTFPRDHYAHREYRTEWWYFSGKLEANDGARYGFELVFFVRRTDNDKTIGIPISYYSNPAHLAHFAITDLQREKFDVTQKRTPDHWTKDGDAGALECSFFLWNQDWVVSQVNDTFVVHASTGDYKLDLMLEPKKPFVLHGENGYFVKAEGPEFPRGTYYIAYTRLGGQGELTVDGEPVKVEATAWMDHEFGSRQLAPDQLGWDWFALQFHDGSELMLYLLKQEDGSHGALSKGAWIDPKGHVTPIKAEDIDSVPVRRWTSPHTGAEYVLDWEIAVPTLDLKLSVNSLLDDQEIDSSKSTMIVYWEGMIKSQGTKGGVPVQADGFMELCGNAHPMNVLSLLKE
jgi:predicted secreted hydrolase